ncbi:TetR/AcrR family transcriptional regulator [Actinomycetes bacterium M1A6_2h]
MSRPTINWSSSQQRQISVRGARTRTRVVDAARELFEDVGFRETTMQSIAAKAGVASGTAYQYFQDKSDILLYLLSELEEQLYRETRLHADETGRFHGHEDIARYLDVYRVNRGLYRAWWEMLEPPTPFTEVWRSLAGYYREAVRNALLSAQSNAVLVEGVGVEVASDIVVSLFERSPLTHIVLEWDADVNDDDLASAMAALIQEGFESE